MSLTTSLDQLSAQTPVATISGSDLPSGWTLSRLSNSEFDQMGQDLRITDANGQTLIVKGYFLTDEHADLNPENGGHFRASWVERLSQTQDKFAQANAQTSEPIGTVETLKGTVTVERADGTRVTLQQGDQVYQDDVVITGADGSIGILFADGSNFSLGGDGKMILDEMVYDPGTQEGAGTVSVLNGTFAFISGQIAKTSPDAMQVKTPSATIGFRGTSGSGEVDGEGNTDIVLIRDPDGTVGEIIVLTDAGLATLSNVLQTASISIDATQPPVIRQMSPAEFNQQYGAVASSLPAAQGAAGARFLDQATNTEGPGDQQDQGDEGDGEGEEGAEGEGEGEEGAEGEGEGEEDAEGEGEGEEDAEGEGEGEEDAEGEGEGEEDAEGEGEGEEGAEGEGEGEEGAEGEGEGEEGAEDEGEEPAGEEPAGEEPAGEEPAGEEPAGEDPAGEDPAGEEPTGEEPTGEEPAGEEPAGEEPAGTEPTGDTTGGTEPTGDTTGGTEPTGDTTGGTEPTGDTTGGTEPTGDTTGGDTTSGDSITISSGSNSISGGTGDDTLGGGTNTGTGDITGGTGNTTGTTGSTTTTTATTATNTGDNDIFVDTGTETTTPTTGITNLSLTANDFNDPNDSTTYNGTNLADNLGFAETYYGTINGLGGNDILYAHDTVYGSYLDGGDGYDTFALSNDTGSYGFDVSATSGSTAVGYMDATYSLTSIEAVTGSSTNDTLTTDSGIDFNAGGGDDMLVMQSQDLQNPSDFTVNASTGTVTTSDNSAAMSFSGVESFTLCMGNDTFTSSTTTKFVDGSDGNNTFLMTAYANGATVQGGVGADIDIVDFSGSNAAHTVYANAADATIYNGSATLYAYNVEKFTGSSAADTFNAYAGTTFDGGAGDDSLNIIGTSATVTMIGGSGSDTFKVSDGTSGGVFTAGAGDTDVLDISVTGTTITDSTGTVTSATGLNVSYTDVDKFVLSGLADTVNMTDGGYTVDAGDGADIFNILGENATGTISASLGDDKIDFSTLTAGTIGGLTVSTSKATSTNASTLDIDYSGIETFMLSLGDDTITTDVTTKFVMGTGGTDTFIVQDYADNAVFHGSPFNTTLNLSTHAENLNVSVNADGASAVVSHGASTLTTTSMHTIVGASGDTLEYSADYGTLNIHDGTYQSATIAMTSGQNFTGFETFTLSSGNDLIQVGNNDTFTVDAAGGNDTLNFSSELVIADTLTDGVSVNAISGAVSGVGAAVVSGQVTGVETFQLTDGKDTIYMDDTMAGYEVGMYGGEDTLDMSASSTGHTFNNTASPLSVSVTSGTITAYDVETIIGSTGNDALVTNDTASDVYFDGNDSVDTLSISSTGAVTVDFVEGYAVNSSTNTFVNFTGVERLYLTGTTDDTVTFGNGYSGYTVDGGAGTDTLDLSEQGAAFSYTDSAGTVVMSAGNTLINFETFYGTTATENIISDGGIYFDAGLGNDNFTQTGASGAATFVGGLGNDTYTAQSSTATAVFSGGGGLDTIDVQSTQVTVNSGANTVSGTALSIDYTDVEKFVLGASNDTVDSRADSGNISVTAGGGDDIFHSGTGTASVDGGEGNDQYYVGQNSGTGTFTAGNGNDTILLSTLTVSSGGATVTGTNIIGTGDLSGASVSHTGVETFWLSDGADTLTYASGMKNIYGQAGNDAFNMAGFDTLTYVYGGDDTDSLSLAGAAESHTITATASMDTIIDSSGNSMFYDTMEVITGTSLSDKFRVEDDDTTGTYVAGLGDDTLDLGGLIQTAGATVDLTAATDTVTHNNSGSFFLSLGLDGFETYGLSNGTDVFKDDSTSKAVDASLGDDVLYAHNDSNTSFDGGDGSDRLTFENISATSGSGVQIDLNATQGTSTGIGTVNVGNSTGFYFKNFETITATGGDDTFTADDNVSTITLDGGAGDDALDLSASTGYYNGEYTAGHSIGLNGSVLTIVEGSGTNTIYGSGIETVIGADYDDNITITSGSINIDAGNGNNYFAINDTNFSGSLGGGTGVDKLDLDSFTVSTSGAVTLDASTGVGTGSGDFGGFAITFSDFDSYMFGDGDDVFNGSVNNDYATGWYGNDTMSGNGGDDTLHGNSGDDTINGNDGNDIINGGLGANLLYGDAGDDDFIIDIGTVSGSIDGGTGLNTIDFRDLFSGVNQTVIDVSAGTFTNAGESIAYTFSNITEFRTDNGALSFVGSGANEMLYAATTSQSITIDMGLGTDTLSYYDTTMVSNGISVIDTDANGELQIDTGLDATFEALSVLGVETLEGSIGADTFTSLIGLSKVYGREGDDSYFSGTGTNIFDAGAGNDLVNIASVTNGDFYDGCMDFDSLYIAASVSSATINASSGSMTVDGNTATFQNFEEYALNATYNSFDGSTGADEVVTYGFDDHIFLGSGDDELYVIAANDLAEYDGGAGVDLLEFDLTNVVGVEIDAEYPAFGLRAVLISDATQGDVEDFSTLSNFEHYILTNGNDRFYGSSTVDENVSGLLGNDQISFSGGTDTLSGGDGTDWLEIDYANNEIARVYADTGYAYRVTSDGLSTIDMATISGFEFYTLGDNNDTFVASAGGDIVCGLGGNDTLTGGSGIDKFAFHVEPQGSESANFAAMGIDVVNGFTVGTDELAMSELIFGLTLSYFGDLDVDNGGVLETSYTTIAGTAGVVALEVGSDTQLWYSSDLSAVSVGSNAFQFATLTGVTGMTDTQLSTASNIYIDESDLAGAPMMPEFDLLDGGQP